jgi:exodeoxyribonuclease V beta subunit
MADELDVFACPLDGIRLVEASAGTGKTWTLCALVMRLLLERGLPLPRILVVTFTNAATAELRERIRARVVETLEVLDGRGPGPGPDRFVPDLLRRLHALGHDDATLRRRLDEALQGFDEAAIHTIHGLCQRALADNAFSAGVPMAQELLADDADLRLQAAQDFWRRRIAGDALPPALAACLLQAGDSPNRWADLLRQRLARPLARLVWPEDLDDTLPDTSALQAAFEQARALWQAARTAIVDTVAEARPRLNGNVYRETAIAAAIAGWDRLLGADDPMADADDRRLALFGAARLVPKKGQQPPAPHPFFACADELLARRRDLAQSLALARLRLLRDFLDEAPVALREAKQARRVLGFDDLLAQLHARLHGPGGDALAAALRTRYPAALIDEFQDTDPLQFAIFQRVYQGTGLPLVLLGDPKQAIYSFRGADLHTYLGARRIAVAEHTLAENQRSAERLLQALNGLFGRQPRAFLQPGLHARPVRRGAKLLPAFADRSAGPGCSCGRCRPAKTVSRSPRVRRRPAPRPPPPARSRAYWPRRHGARSRSATGPWAPATSPCWCAPTARARCSAAHSPTRGWAAWNCRRPASSTAPRPRSWTACSPPSASPRANRWCVPRWLPG